MSQLIGLGTADDLYAGGLGSVTLPSMVFRVQLISMSSCQLDLVVLTSSSGHLKIYGTPSQRHFDFTHHLTYGVVIPQNNYPLI